MENIMVNISRSKIAVIILGVLVFGMEYKGFSEGKIQKGDEMIASKPAVLKKNNFFGKPDPLMTMEKIVEVGKKSHLNGKFSWDDYRALLTELSKSRYKVVSLKDFASTDAKDVIVVGMRHDSDARPDKALIMLGIEKEFGIHSTYFFLHSDEYYGRVKNGIMIRNQGFDELVQEIYKEGFEVGIHTDLFTMMWEYQFDPVSFVKAEIAYYKNLGIPIIGSTAHGAYKVIHEKVNNTWIFSDFGRPGSIIYNGYKYEYGKYSIADFCFSYEGYALKRDYYTGDIDRSLRGKPASALIEKIKKIKSPAKLMILTHTERWGR